MRCAPPCGIRQAFTLLRNLALVQPDFSPKSALRQGGFGAGGTGRIALTECIRLTLGCCRSRLDRYGLSGRAGIGFALAEVCAACRCRARGTDASAAADHRSGERRRRRPHALSPPHPYRRDRRASPSSATASTTRASSRELNLFLADWRHQEADQDGSRPLRPALGGLPGSRRQPADQHRLVLPLARDQRACCAPNPPASPRIRQHMNGKAMDFFIPGVPLSSCCARRRCSYQVGGVGYYPTSGSPFVHLDTGTVRAWPRMTRAQLKKVFPDGRTLHLPADGKPLSADGRRYAEAEWNKCHMVPCNGADSAPTTADAAPCPRPRPQPDGRDLRRRLATTSRSPPSKPRPSAPSTPIDVSAPVPLIRPATLRRCARRSCPSATPSEPFDVAALRSERADPAAEVRAPCWSRPAPRQPADARLRRRDRARRPRQPRRPDAEGARADDRPPASRARWSPPTCRPSRPIPAPSARSR